MSAAILLLYLGRVLVWTCGSKPLGPADIVFLVPIALVLLLVPRRGAPTNSRPSTAVANVDWSDDAAWVAQREEVNEEGPDEKEILRRIQEWAADYHWWKR